MCFCVCQCVCLGVCMWVTAHLWQSVFGSQFCPFTIWNGGIKLRWPGRASGAFTLELSLALPATLRGPSPGTYGLERPPTNMLGILKNTLSECPTHQARGCAHWSLGNRVSAWLSHSFLWPGQRPLSKIILSHIPIPHAQSGGSDPKWDWSSFTFSRL